MEGKPREMVTLVLADKNIGVVNGNCYGYRLMETLQIYPEQGVLGDYFRIIHHQLN